MDDRAQLGALGQTLQRAKAIASLPRTGPAWKATSNNFAVIRAASPSLGLSDVVDHYEQIIRELETPPIIIGYGFGGLVTQILLDRGWGAAGVAIASAPVKGIARLPLSMLKLAFSVLGKSLSNKTASLTAEQFHHAFANSLTETESLDAFKRYIVPAPNRVLLQTAFANFTPDTATTVNFRNDTRAPLLLVAGGKDRVVPSSLVKANFDLYRESKAETDYKEFRDRTHFIIGQDAGRKSRTMSSVGHLAASTDQN